MDLKKSLFTIEIKHYEHLRKRAYEERRDMSDIVRELIEKDMVGRGE